jgi:hypothetical protein
MNATIGGILKIAMDNEFVSEIKAGYRKDKFCKQIMDCLNAIQGVTKRNGLLYIGSRLLIPRVTNIREMIFRLAHDNLGHFGRDKSYAALWDDYYWPNMQKELEESYIPGCAECQRNKSPTWKPVGPLHPGCSPSQTAGGTVWRLTS